MPLSTLTDDMAHHERQLRDANEKVLAAVALLEVRVIAAREDGLSWLRVGTALGISRQAATARFTKLPELLEIEDVKRG